MMETVKLFDGRRFLLRQQEQGENLPLVVCIFQTQGTEVILEAVDRPLNVLMPLDLEWDEDLSPWAHDPVVMKDDHFTGQGPVFAKTVAETTDWARTLTGSTKVILAGYSMGGLFSLFAPTVAGAYDALVCASGSVWFPGFTEYMKTHAFLKQPAAIWLSLGNKETQVKNPVLQTTWDCMEELKQQFGQEGIVCMLHQDQGNHFQDAAGRIARGILWSLEQL